MNESYDNFQARMDAATLQSAAAITADAARAAKAKEELAKQQAAISAVLGDGSPGVPSDHPAHKEIGLTWVKGG